MYQEFDTYLGQRKYQEIKDEPGIEFFSGRFYVRTLENFYVRFFWRIQIIAVFWMRFQKKNLKT